MKFGIFDYIDQRGEPLNKLYNDRMQFLRAAEHAGFYGYHVTEHHVTPLSTTPSPTVYLAAAARETTRIRLGALLFLLPLYHPLRLLEELCMLDHLSNGRLDIGVGRGIARARSLTPPHLPASGRARLARQQRQSSFMNSALGAARLDRQCRARRTDA